MIQFIWKIGKKKRQGNYLTPVEFSIWFVYSEDFLYDFEMYLTLECKLPDKIYFGKTDINPDGEIDDPSSNYLYKGCKSVDTISFNIAHSYTSSKYYREQALKSKTKYYYVGSLIGSSCHGRCRSCSAYLPWRPGVPDYSDFEATFTKIIHVICEEWNNAVEEAKKRKQDEKGSEAITSRFCKEKIVIKMESSNVLERKLVEIK